MRLFTPASLITDIFQSISREAELLCELKVLGYSVAVEVLQGRKVSGREKILESVTTQKDTEQHCFSK